MDLRFLLVLFLVHFNLFSFDRILFDVDPIDNNQILLNNYNPDILDTLSYKSIVFHQSHNLPFGTFIFNQIDHLSTIDSTGQITQFIHKKGDYRFRDLIVSSYKINNQNAVFRYAGHTRSYTPLNIYSINGTNFLQNHLFDVSKQTEFSYLSSTLLYHTEKPNLPISYYSYNNQDYYNTRKSQSLLWGFTYKTGGEKFSLKVNTSSQLSFLTNNLLFLVYSYFLYIDFSLLF